MESSEQQCTKESTIGDPSLKTILRRRTLALIRKVLVDNKIKLATCRAYVYRTQCGLPMIGGKKWQLETHVFRTIVSIRCFYPDPMDESKRVKFSEFFCRANEHMELGGWKINFENGDIWWEMHVPLEEDYTVSYKMAKLLIERCLCVTDRYKRVFEQQLAFDVDDEYSAKELFQILDNGLDLITEDIAILDSQLDRRNKRLSGSKRNRIDDDDDDDDNGAAQKRAKIKQDD